MLLAVVGVPAKFMPGNRLNLPAYTAVRYLCEGLLEALPSALVSTAALDQQVLSQETNYMQLGVFWLSLMFSMLRIARELYKLPCPTHDLDACCFSTAILDMIYHVQQPQQGAGASAQGQLPGNASRGLGNSSSKPAPASMCRPIIAAPQHTGMTGDSAVTPSVSLAVADSSAGASGSPQIRSVSSDAAVAADTSVAGVVSAGGLLPASSNSKDSGGCCWSCQSCTDYPSVLAVYVYCCLGCLVVYLLLVCSDVAYPWLLSADARTVRLCNYDASGVPVCREYWNHTMPPFSQQYNPLMMIRSVPGLSNGTNATADCVLPSLTCEY